MNNSNQNLSIIVQGRCGCKGIRLILIDMLQQLKYNSISIFTLSKMISELYNSQCCRENNHAVLKNIKINSATYFREEPHACYTSMMSAIDKIPF